ncbi:MAG: hypothetical protein JSU96_06735 [Acidobacteriota bacterium]|nr:MAG: hypothetical protein JSU96_06735 [Acidobacteriota bacterium]
MSRTLQMVLVFAAVLMTGCGPSTRIETAWKAPDLQPTSFKKLVAIVMSKDQTLRRIAEDEFVRSLPGGTQGIPGYSLLPEDKIGDPESAKAVIKESGVDGAVVLRVVGVDKDLQYSPGTPHYTFYGYYGWAWTSVNTPDYLKLEKTVRIEASAYSVANEKLVWTAQSASTDPKSVRSLIDDVVRLVVKEMTKLQLVG